MFDIGWTELAIVALIALLVIGPKELPATMRMIAGWIGKIRGLAREFQGGLDDMMRETELDKLKEQAQGVMHGDLDGVVENTIDPGGSIRDELDYGAGYEPFGDFDDPEPEPEPEPKPAAKKTEASADAKASAAAAGSAKAKTTAKSGAKSGAKTRTKSRAKSGAASAGNGAAKPAAKPAAKAPPKSSKKSAAAKSAPARKTAASKRTAAAKPRGSGAAKSDG